MRAILFSLILLPSILAAALKVDENLDVSLQLVRYVKLLKLLFVECRQVAVGFGFPVSLSPEFRFRLFMGHWSGFLTYYMATGNAPAS